MKQPPHIWRDASGVPHIEATDDSQLYFYMGVAHAVDRGLQLSLMKILGLGRASELLDSGDELLQIDIFFRKMNWGGHGEDELKKLDSETLKILTAYCEGINTGLTTHYPWEFRLMGVKREIWKPQDTLMISRMIGYLTLAQSQGEIERLFVEMVQAGVSREKLDELFPGMLGECDMGLIRKVKLQERIVPGHILWETAAPRMMASNNWVISGKKSLSGKPLLANDPHLEINRLPGVWYEISLKVADRYMMGFSMPGIPGVLAGRNNTLSWGVTYAFADTVDSWIEHCRDGNYDREGRWEAFDIRTEVIRRKKKPPATVSFYENRHGVLDGDPTQEGYYLATRWAAAGSGSAGLTSALAMKNASTVSEGMELMGRLETAWNWVFADTLGNIGYQMSGLVPRRRNGANGFIPLPGWETRNDWQGFLDSHDLPRRVNPEEGFIVTANQDLNAFGIESPINIAMGSYRADRIASLIAASAPLSCTRMSRFQYDIFSIQAERFMEILKPMLPDTPQGQILQHWDYTYSPDSIGAYLFEAFYKNLLISVFGAGMGDAATRHIESETGVFIDFYANFDRILLSENSSWFRGKHRNEIFRNAATAALHTEPRRWGDVQQITMKHILFGGKLPSFLGFDRGPITLSGGRATPLQGQIYRSAGRTSTFAPSFRMLTDLSEDAIYTHMPGGPSEKRFSKWYVSDLRNWIEGKYKCLKATDDARLPFP